MLSCSTLVWGPQYLVHLGDPYRKMWKQPLILFTGTSETAGDFRAMRSSRKGGGQSNGHCSDFHRSVADVKLAPGAGASIDDLYWRRDGSGGNRNFSVHLPHGDSPGVPAFGHE